MYIKGIILYYNYYLFIYIVCFALAIGKLSFSMSMIIVLSVLIFNHFQYRFIVFSKPTSAHEMNRTIRSICMGCMFITKSKKKTKLDIKKH